MALTDLRPLAAQAMEHRGTIADVVIAVLRDAILTGVLREGEELNQVQLAAQFGISRVPVREGLRRLEAEGLVVSRAHKRTVVSSLGPRRVEELMEILIALESMAIRHAVANMSQSGIDSLDDLQHRMETEPDYKQWLSLNQEFHQGILKYSGRDVLTALTCQVRSNLERYLWAHGLSTERRQEANAEHRAVMAAFRTGDADKTAAELGRHLRGTLEGMLAQFRSRQELRAQ